MSILNTFLPKVVSYYYPIGNTPPVCLTQDLPPEQDADILLLGCGDARNILFTCFADESRPKIDVTCCDIESMIHARNVLLYTLLIDDYGNENIERIWNIYYHWKIDGDSLELLESKTQELLRVSQSIDEWNSSVYGSSIRFCDERSLSSVRCHWSGFTSKGLSTFQKKRRQNQLQAAIDRAKANRHKKEGPDITGYRSVFPMAMDEREIFDDLCKVTEQWWNCGMVGSSNSSSVKLAHLNPAFLYSPNQLLTIDFGVSPIGSIPLSTAYIPLKGSALCIKKKGESSAEYLVNCAKKHFELWAPAFRIHIRNGLKIRIFSGHAFPFCFTLRNCQLTQSTSMNLFCHNWTGKPLILHNGDYGHSNDAAPVSFDIIETSNLADYLGPLNLIALASSLLKHRVSSCLYTELLVLFDLSLTGRLSDLFGVDVRSVSLLLGLVPPDLFTNATNTVEESPDICKISESEPSPERMPTARSRLRWRRFGGYQASSSSPRIQVEARELTRFLVQVYKAMLKLEGLNMFNFSDLHGQSRLESELFKLHLRPYNRASFAFVLSCFKATILSDWGECLAGIYEDILFSELKKLGLVKNNFDTDLLLSLHIFGVDSSLFVKPNPEDRNSAILAGVIPINEDLPDLLCVTIRVSREHLQVFAKPCAITSFFIICSFVARYSNGEQYTESFSSVHLTFGKWHEQSKEKDSHPYIEEDAEISGTSDMFVSVMVPTSMLTSMLPQSEQFVPLVKCGLNRSMLNKHYFSESLGPDLYFFSSEITSEDVFVTQFMPGMPGPPKFNFTDYQPEQVTSGATVVHFSNNDSKINSLVQRITLESETEKSKLSVESSNVKVDFKSPLIAVVSVAGSLEFKLEFPVPVSRLKHNINICRELSYIEVEACLFDPLEEKTATFLFPCFLSKTSRGIVPVPWTSMRVDLDVMPSLDLENSPELTWLLEYTVQMLSKREFLIHSAKGFDVLVSLKARLTTMFMIYTGFNGSKADIFSLENNVGNYVTILIFPSSLRLDLANNTVVLDSALLSLTKDLSRDPLVSMFLEELETNIICTYKVPEQENVAWRAMLPAAVERCRTWSHKSGCEYVQSGKIPLPKGVRSNGESPICSCGIGKFPTNYLKGVIERFSTLDDVLRRYATRVAISPIFALPYVEDCDTTDLRAGACKNCGSTKRQNAVAGQQSLLLCSRCRTAKYCSVDCQKSHWRLHKPFCKAAPNK